MCSQTTALAGKTAAENANSWLADAIVIESWLYQKTTINSNTLFPFLPMIWRANIKMGKCCSVFRNSKRKFRDISRKMARITSQYETVVIISVVLKLIGIQYICPSRVLYDRLVSTHCIGPIVQCASVQTHAYRYTHTYICRHTCELYDMNHIFPPKKQPKAHTKQHCQSIYYSQNGNT